MSEQTSNFTFGQYLKSKRHEAGFDLEYISSDTKIGMDILKAIEDEDHSRLPEPVFVKGFIRAFSRIVGADENKAVQTYLESRSDYMDRAKSDIILPGRKNNSLPLPRLIMWAAIVFFTIGFAALSVSLYRYHFSSRHEPPSYSSENSDKPQLNETLDDSEFLAEEPVDNTRIPEEEPVDLNETSTETLPESIVNLQPDTTKDETPEIETSHFELSIQAIADTWLKAIMDAEKPVEYLLKPGDKITLKAEKQYNLLIGNAGGVHIFLNGQPVQISGKSGQVINLKLP